MVHNSKVIVSRTPNPSEPKQTRALNTSLPPTQ